MAPDTFSGVSFYLPLGVRGVLGRPPAIPCDTRMTRNDTHQVTSNLFLTTLFRSPAKALSWLLRNELVGCWVHGDNYWIYIFLGFYSSLDPTTNATRKAIRIPQLKLHRYKHKIGTNWARIPEFDPGCHHPGKHHWHQCRCHHVAGLVPSLLQS